MGEIIRRFGKRPGKSAIVAAVAAAAVFLSLAGSAEDVQQMTYERPDGKKEIVKVKKIQPPWFASATFFAAAPMVQEVTASGTALLVWETRVPAPAGRVYFGSDHPDDPRRLPRFRKTADEAPGEPRFSHRVAVPFVALAAPEINDFQLNQPGVYTIHFRVENFDPAARQLKLYDTRVMAARAGDGRWSKAPASVLQGPSVNQVTSQSAVIAVDTDEPLDLYVAAAGRRFGPAQRFREFDGRYRHELTLTGLKPATTYAYRVVLRGPQGDLLWPTANRSSWGQAAPLPEFATAPEKGSTAPFTFAAMSDGRSGYGAGEEAENGVNFAALRTLLPNLARWKPSFVLFAGDMIDGGVPDYPAMLLQYRTWSAAVEPLTLSLPFYAGRGNHDLAGTFYQVTRPDGDEIVLQAEDSGDQISGTSYANHFVSPVGSVYPEAGRPLPEARLPYMPRHVARGPDYGESVYSLNHGNLHVVMLNSNYWQTTTHLRHDSDPAAVDLALSLFGGVREGYLMDHQLGWLERDLQAAQSDPAIQHVIVCSHEPAFPVGGHVADAMCWAGDDPQGRCLNDPRRPAADVVHRRDRFWTALANHDKVLAVISGDEHVFALSLIDEKVNKNFRHPIYQVISGGLGAPYYAFEPRSETASAVQHFTARRHFVLFEVAGRKVTLRAISLEGDVLHERVLRE